MRKVLAVCGATATGKTALAVECAKRLNGEVVSCDALLVYRGLNVGTAKPTKEEMDGIAHHLIDVVDPSESFSVSDFERLACAAVEDILSRGKTPVLCGGTAFYMNAVLFPSSFGGAPADPALRARLEAKANEEGNDALHAMLEKIDPESAARLHPNDVKRVIRAIEIYSATGKRKSQQNDARTPRYPYAAVAVDYPREELYRRIEARVDKMLQAGLVEEVRALLEAGVPETAQCMQGIGYHEVVEMLKNGFNLSITRDTICKNTRNYAKRQLTFLRKMPGLAWIEPHPQAAEEVCTIYDS